MRKEFKTALLIALAGFAWAVIEFITGLHSSRIELHSVITWFAMIPVLFIYIWHYRQIKKHSQGQLTFKKGFLSGMFVTGVAMPLSMIGFLLFYYLINPNFFTAFTNYSVENKIMTTEEASKYFNLNSYLVQIAIGILIIGLLLSLILSFIFKSKAK